LTGVAGELRGGGAEVTCLPHPGLVHGFAGMAHISPAAARARDNLFQHFGSQIRGHRPSAAG
jgi:hypothetical protein